MHGFQLYQYYNKYFIDRVICVNTQLSKYYIVNIRYTQNIDISLQTVSLIYHKNSFGWGFDPRSLGSYVYNSSRLLYCLELLYGRLFLSSRDRCLLVEDSCAVIIGDASDKF